MKRKNYIFLLALVVLLNSCATLIGTENVRLRSEDKKASVYVSGYSRNLDVKQQVSKHRPLVVTAYRRGHRPKSDIIMPKTFDFGVFLTAAFWGAMISVEPTPGNIVYGGIFTFIDLKSSKYRHKRNISVSAPTPFVLNEESDLYVYACPRLDSIYLDKIGYAKVSKIKQFEQRENVQTIPTAYEKTLSVTSWLNSRLELMNYQNSQPELITNYNNTCQIDFEILDAKKYVFKEYAQAMDLKMRFYVCDGQGKRLKSIEVSGHSQPFAFNGFSWRESDDDEILQDAIFDGLMQFLSTDEWLSSKKNILTLLESEIQNWEALTLSKPIISNPDFYEMIDSQVTVLTDDEGYHGSGCMISPEGHLLASFRVVEDRDTFDVAFSDGKIKKATVIRKDPLSNIVLAKVDTLGNSSVQLQSKKAFEYGDAVFSVGSPVSKELSQSLFSGIVSGNHVQNGLNYIQTDVKVSNGNNGSPLINDRGELIGIINEKYIGYSFEGISFAVTSFDILERLKLNYK